MKSNKIKNYTTAAILLSIMLLIFYVPFLGFIPIGPIKSTTMHIPVIIGSILLGPKLGAFLGTSFGIVSVWNATINPTPLSFVFSPFVPIPGTSHGSWQALIVAIIPRILIGIVPYYVFRYFKLYFKKNTKTLLFFSGVAGSLTNTLIVMNLIYFLFNKEYSSLIGKSGGLLYNVILSIIFTNGFTEAVCAGILTSSICTIYHKYIK